MNDDESMPVLSASSRDIMMRRGSLFFALLKGEQSPSLYSGRETLIKLSVKNAFHVVCEDSQPFRSWFYQRKAKSEARQLLEQISKRLREKTSKSISIQFCSALG